MDLTAIATILEDLGIIIPVAELAIIIPIIVWISKIANGMKCQHRTEMLRTYYRHKDDKQIRQYEYENFEFLYQSYKALKGNSFIDKIYKEVQTWKIIS